MPFIADILKHRSVSVTGLEKNTGKTYCLNYIIERLRQLEKNIAVTSIGLDGEQADVLSGAAKPAITVHPGTVFVTAENLFRQKTVDAEILDVSTRQTPLGRLITARALGNGQVVLAGPADTTWLKQILKQLNRYNIQLSVVDGAFSRLSHAAPAVTGCMVLNTGASVSTDLSTVIERTRFACDLVRTAKAELAPQLADTLLAITKGIYGLRDNGEYELLDIPSAYHQVDRPAFAEYRMIYVAGAVTNNLLSAMSGDNAKIQRTLVVRDFSRLFIDTAAFRSFSRSGNHLAVLDSTTLIAVCFNPVHPGGFRFDSDLACAQLSEAIQLPVYDLKRIQAHETILN